MICTLYNPVTKIGKIGTLIFLQRVIMEYSFTTLFWKVRNIRIVIQFHSMILNILPEMGQILIITNCSQNQGSLLKSQKKICAPATCGLCLHKTYRLKIIRTFSNKIWLFMQNIGGGSISIQISMATPKLPFSSIH